MFCHSVRKQVAAMDAAVDGIDLLVFTGGIGKNDAEARMRHPSLHLRSESHAEYGSWLYGETGPSDSVLASESIGG
jgi:hypothetical protein